MYPPKLFIILGLFLSFFAHAQKSSPLTSISRPLFGVIIPLEDESALILKNMTHMQHFLVEGIHYSVGKINNKNIVLVNSGLGKINASIVATRIIRDVHPDVILLSGSSGNINPHVKKGEVVIGDKVIDADFGTLTSYGIEFQYAQYLYNPQIKASLPLEFKLDNHLREQIIRLNRAGLPKITLAKIATSDALPNPISQIKLLQQGKFDVIEMEGSAVMQVCWLFKVPCGVIRGVSNNAKEPITQNDIKYAADNAAKVLITFISNYER